MHINKHPDEDAFMPIVARVMEDRRPFAVQSTVADVWMMISALQFCTRVDALNFLTRERFEQIARSLLHVIAATHPDAVELAEMGFDSRHDVVRIGDPDYADDFGPFSIYEDDDEDDDEDSDE